MGEGKQPQPAVTTGKEPAEGGKHPLVGAGLHYKDEHGRVLNQASIVAVIPSNSAAGDLALIQYIEWMSGEASTRRLIPLSDLASSERWVLYGSAAEMSDHFERSDESRNAAISKRLENDKDRAE
jgi:hypothetical protein